MGLLLAAGCMAGGSSIAPPPQVTEAAPVKAVDRDVFAHLADELVEEHAEAPCPTRRLMA